MLSVDFGRKSTKKTRGKLFGLPRPVAGDPHEFAERVTELRLQAARKMLADRSRERLKVIDVAYAVGFNEVSYFNRRFRRRFGEKPSQARGGPED